ncbi:MAG TPA: hypothetical protein VGX76_08535, partial [Pirellulales bacterium]|nr:hypothetical protein [Pirellulales bacterium]
HLAGMAHWQVYLKEKAKPEESRDQDRMAAHRAKAVDEFKASLQAQRKALGSETALPRELIDTQLRLADTEIDAGNLDEASRLLEPLVDFIAVQPPEPRDPMMTYVLLDALITAVKRRSAADAAPAATALIERGDDSAKVNGALIDYASLLHDDWKSPSAAGTTPAANGSAAAAFDAKAQLLRVLKHLAGRPDQKPAALCYIGETLAEIGMSDQARDLYQAVLGKIGQEANVSPADAKLRMRVRTKLVALLRAEGKHDEALGQVESLIEDAKQPGKRTFPLEPMLEKGYILQDLKKFDEALRQWTTIRTAMKGMKKQPDEFYDVVYRAAVCLVALAEQEDGKKKEGREKKKEKYLQAEKLLVSMLTVSPNLNGQAMVAKYKELQAQIDKAQPKAKTKDKPKPKKDKAAA